MNNITYFFILTIALILSNIGTYFFCKKMVEQKTLMLWMMVGNLSKILEGVSGDVDKLIKINEELLKPFINDVLAYHDEIYNTITSIEGDIYKLKKRKNDKPKKYRRYYRNHIKRK